MSLQEGRLIVMLTDRALCRVKKQGNLMTGQGGRFKSCIHLNRFMYLYIPLGMGIGKIFTVTIPFWIMFNNTILYRFLFCGEQSPCFFSVVGPR